MTQPAPVDAFRAFVLRIQDEAELTEDEIEALERVQKKGAYQVGAPFPQGPEGAGYVIFMLFEGSQGERATEDAHVPGDIRAYCVPTGANAASYPPVRYTISGLGTAHGVITTVNMPVPDTFIGAIAHELRQMAICQGLVEDVDEDGDDDIEELVTCPKCQTENDPENKFCGGCSEPLGKAAPAQAPASAVVS